MYNSFNFVTNHINQIVKHHTCSSCNGAKQFFSQYPKNQLRVVVAQNEKCGQASIVRFLSVWVDNFIGVLCVFYTF